MGEVLVDNTLLQKCSSVQYLLAFRVPWQFEIAMQNLVELGSVIHGGDVMTTQYIFCPLYIFL